MQKSAFFKTDLQYVFPFYLIYVFLAKNFNLFEAKNRFTELRATLYSSNLWDPLLKKNFISFCYSDELSKNVKPRPFVY